MWIIRLNVYIIGLDQAVLFGAIFSNKNTHVDHKVEPDLVVVVVVGVV